MRAMLNRLARTIVPPQTLGALRHRQDPKIRTWGGPFNGQGKRCLLFASMVSKLEPFAIVETGTYLGTTSEWVSAFQIPVFTVEVNPENYGYAKERLDALPNVQTILSDSRSGLTSIIAKVPDEHHDKCVIFYLDAHWGADLPLADEITIIFRAMPNAVVMIDDFEVQGDAGYCYDDYGQGKSLTFDYIRNMVDSFKLRLFYPTALSSEETGAKRGCLVVCASDLTSAKLSEIELLRKSR
jgi:predicted O-methyltransferase YrrM